MTDSDQTIGEIGRSVTRIEAVLAEFRKEFSDETHSLRNKINASDLKLGVLESRLGTVETASKDRQGWVAGAVSGGLIAALGAWLQTKLGVH